MACTRDSRQVSRFAEQSLLRKPGKGNSFQIITIHPENVSCLYLNVWQQGDQAIAHGLIVRSTTAQINFFCAPAMFLYGLCDGAAR